MLTLFLTRTHAYLIIAYIFMFYFVLYCLMCWQYEFKYCILEEKTLGSVPSVSVAVGVRRQ